MAVLGLPVTLIGGSVLSVFYPRINEAILNGEDARALIVKTTMAMAAVGVLPFLPIVLVGPLLFEFLFGAGWGTAGSYAQWLSLWLFAAFANRPAVTAIPALKLQVFLLVPEMVSVMARVSALYFGFVVLDDAVAGIAAFGVVGMVLNTFLISYVIRRSPKAGASS